MSRSLKRYLQDTAIELGLERLPIRDFEEYRTHLSNRFGLTRSFRRNEAEVPACRTQLEWLRAVDSAIAHSVAAKLDEVVAKNTEIPPPVRQAVQRFSLELKGTESRPQAPVFHLSGLAQRLVESVLQVEYRSRENAIRERSSRNEFRDRFDLEKELAQVRQEEERGVISPFVRQLLGLLAIEDLFVDAVHRGAFASRVRAAFGGAPNTEINESIDEVRALFAPKKENERRTLTDADLLVLIVCAAMIADGFDYPNAPSHFHRVRRSTCVFIDEVQDFTEIEVFLMGMAASKEYHQITLSGDLCQRLQWSGSTVYDHLFPSVPRSSQNKSIFLDRNLRQRDPLARLSAGFRNVLQGDKRLDFIAGNTPPALLHCYTSSAAVAPLILEHIASVNEYATVAVIAPTEQEATKWHALLRAELATGRRLASLSRREDLTGRFEIHFTQVYETKGLEFDVVIVPDLGAFELENEIGRNQAYVAISRPRYALFLGCSSSKCQSKEISTLVANKLVKLVNVI